jgi:hypothetical protein
MPTDPIPQPVATGADAWTVPQGTVPYPGSPYPPGPPQPPRAPEPRSGGRTGLIVTLVVIVLLLGGGGAFAAYHYLSKSTPTTPGTATSPTAGPTDQFPYTVKEGDCLINVGTAKDPVMQTSSCSAPGSYKVVRVARGRGIPVGPSDKFDATTTSVQVCAGTAYQNWYGLQRPNADENLFFCLVNN